MEAIYSSSPNAVNFFEDAVSLTLEEFKKQLPKTIELMSDSQGRMAPDVHQISSLFSRLKLNAIERERCMNFDATKDYTRNLVVTDNRFYTLLMLCWNPGKSSPVHDHPCDGCWMKVLKGRVQETLYVPMANGSLKPTMEQIHSEGEQSFIQDSMGYHKVSNPSPDEVAITLHLYCPPYDECTIWLDPAKGQPSTAKICLQK